MILQLLGRFLCVFKHKYTDWSAPYRGECRIPTTSGFATAPCEYQVRLCRRCGAGQIGTTLTAPSQVVANG